MAGKLKRFFISIVALLQALAPLPVQAADATSSTGSVTIVPTLGAPIEISQAQFISGLDELRLWIVYRNVSPNTVDRFAVTLTWRTTAGRTIGRLYKMVNTPTGVGELTTAELTGIGSLRANAQSFVSVTRARFRDLALWVAPRPPPALHASVNQPIAGREPITTMAYPIGPIRPTINGRREVDRPESTAPTSVAPRSVLAQGTLISLSLDTAVSSANASNGDRIEFRVADNVLAGGAVVVPVGSRGFGHLEAVKRAGIFGRSGSFTFVPDMVVTPSGGVVPLQGSTAVQPPITASAIIANLTIFGGLFARGREAVLPAGSIVTGATATQIAAN